MNPQSEPWLSLIVPVLGEEPGLEACLASLEALSGQDCETLLVADGEAGQRALAGAARGPWRVVSQPPQGAAAARALGLSQARGEVALFLAASCRVPAQICRILREIMDGTDASGMGVFIKPGGGEGALARLAGLELGWQVQAQGLPLRGCAALRREEALEAGGLDQNLPGPQGDLLALWLRMKAGGLQLYWDPEVSLRAELPATWRGLLGQAWAEGCESFQRARLAAGLGPGLLAGQGNARAQAFLAMLAPALLAGLWSWAPDRALTLALISLLLLYPLNRSFIRHVGETAPDLFSPCLGYCLLRPFAWLGGMLASAGRRLGA